MRNVIKKQWFYTNCNVMYVYLECDAASQDIRLTMFRDTIIISFSTVWGFSWSFFVDLNTVEIKTISCLETSGTERRVTQRHVLLPHPHRCENIKTRKLPSVCQPVDTADRRLNCLRPVILPDTYSCRAVCSNICHLRSASHLHIATPQFRQGTRVYKERGLTGRTVSVAL
jgi:hypothetical protein